MDLLHLNLLVLAVSQLFTVLFIWLCLRRVDLMNKNILEMKVKEGQYQIHNKIMEGHIKSIEMHLTNSDPLKMHKLDEILSHVKDLNVRVTIMETRLEERSKPINVEPKQIVRRRRRQIKET